MFTYMTSRLKMDTMMTKVPPITHVRAAMIKNISIVLWRFSETSENRLQAG